MNISLEETAKILNKTTDEVMYLHQSGKIEVTVNEDTLNWEFALKNVLALKSVLDEEAAELAEEMDE